MTEWVLVLTFLSPGGDVMGQRSIVQDSYHTCQRSLVTLNREAPMAKIKAECRKVLTNGKTGVIL